MFEGPNIPVEEEPKPSSPIGGKVRRAIQGTALGLGLLGAEAATNNAEAQRLTPDVTHVEKKRGVLDKVLGSHAAETRDVDRLFEYGKEHLGEVFEQDGKLYLVASANAEDFNLASETAERTALSLAAEFMAERRGESPEITFEASSTESREDVRQTKEYGATIYGLRTKRLETKKIGDLHIVTVLIEFEDK